MEYINNWLDSLCEHFKGHELLVQIFIDDKLIMKRGVDGTIQTVGMNCGTVGISPAKENLHNVGLGAWMEKEINHATVCEATRRNHRAMLKHLRGYSADACLGDVDYRFILEYDYYLRHQGMAVNTVAKNMKIFRRYLRIAVKTGLLGCSPFDSYTIRMEQTHRRSLTFDELSIIERRSKSIGMTNEEREVLAAFRFACVTGLRFSDVQRVSSDHIKKGKGGKWLVMCTQKTGCDIRIPLANLFNGIALKILSERRGELLFALPGNKRSNMLLNRVLTRIGIKWRVTFHVARHTTATLLLNVGVPVTTVQTILGHQSVKTTQIYSAVTDTTVYQDIARGFKGKRCD